MNIYPLALALVIVANATWVFRRYVAPWWKRRHQLVEQCEVCSKWLRPGQVRELRSDSNDDDQAMAEIGGTMGGGTYMVATYCRKHFPK